MRRLFAVSLCTAFLLQGCGGLGGDIFEERDRAPHRPPDVSKVPDAVPRAEAKSRYGNPKSYVVFGKRYYPMQSARGFRERGIASWYGEKFHGRKTSNGEAYDMYAMTAAHKTLPLPTYVRVTNLKNGRSTVVRVNDRGPFHENRIIDLSYTAAKKLDIIRTGTGLVEITAVFAGDSTPAPATLAAKPVPRATAIPNTPRLFIQVGAFANPDNAQRLRTRLRSMFERGVSIQVADGVNRVRLGPLDGVEDADRLIDMLAEAGIEEAHLIIE